MPDMDDDLTRLARESGAPASERSQAETGAHPSGFDPGTVFAGRFRIVALLGRGGMGEVYRADDLKLGQPVALKLLPERLAGDPARLAQFHNEVRVAREVSHRNVCRTYDIGEAGGRHFISMEYVDGEDLASLLRRIGRFPQDRAVEVARQICAGIAAAHERGVLHRDLKPANIMIDGEGHVRITDFGLAGVAGRFDDIRSGTPAYMAPEQLAGREVSIRSDIYALGLVLFELFTGRRVFEAANLNELVQLHESGTVRTPSSVVRDLDPMIERAILRCLERDPENRPSSALVVSAALPGGSPLAAALAAGETPSPEMVAAAGEQSALRPTAGLAGVAVALIFLAAIAMLADRALLFHRIPITRSSDALRDRAQEMLERAGYTEPPRDTAIGWFVSSEYWNSATARAERWQALPTGRAPTLLFWYRTSPADLIPSFGVMPAPNDPQMALAGMRLVVLDPQGRLVQLRSIPAAFIGPSPPAAPDWAPLFDAAVLPMSSFHTVEPEWTPRDYADTRAAWEGPLPDVPGATARVEAAAFHGTPTFFRVVGSWTPAPAALNAPAGASTMAVASSAVRLLLLAGAVVLARHNLRNGRGDRRGALRTAAIVFGSLGGAWVLAAHHFTTEVETQLAPILYSSAVLWVSYLALEPYVRRFWPEFMMGWTRLLSGHVRDPLVGRDVLIGTLAGLLLSIVILAHGLFPGAPPIVSLPTAFLGARFTLVSVLQILQHALEDALQAIFGVVVVKMIVRKTIVVVPLIMLIFFPVAINGMFSGTQPAIDVPFTLVTEIIMLTVLLRHGLLSLTVTFFVFLALTNLPITADLSKPYSAVSLWLLGGAAGLAAFGFYASRGSEPLFGRPILD